MNVAGRADNPRLGLAGRSGLVLDANAGHATALAGHMEAKRAHEIADALVPPDLYGFTRNGRHGWRALELAVEYLGDRASDLDLRSPRDERVVLHHTEVELRPLLGRADSDDADHDDHSRAGIIRTPVGYGDGGDRVTRISYSLGGVDDAEYAALIGRAGESVTDLEAWDHIAGYMKLSPATQWQARYLHSVDELHPVDDSDVYCELADALSIVSRTHVLAVGDIVRTGTRRTTTLLDLTASDLDALEHLLTHADR
jgi:hypothetical protein